MSENQPKEQPSEEVELGQLFKLIGRSFDRFFRFIGNIFYGLFLAFVWLVFFTKRHLIKIVLAGVLGFAYGFIKQKASVPVYKSTAIIKQNYKTGENLYLLMDVYNALISQKDSMALAQNLEISPSEANSIGKFEIESTLSENQKLKLFDEYTKAIDSTLASTLEFSDFMKNSNEYEYAFQKITVRAYSKNIFRKVLKKIIQKAEESEFIINEQKKDIAELDRREVAINQSLKASDSLQKVYQRVLEKSVESSLGSQTSVTIDNTEDKSITKEFELFNIDLELKRELVDIQREKDDIQNIIEIVSSEQIEGSLDNSKAVFGFEVSKKIAYAITLALMVYLVLLTIEFINFLKRFKNKV